ncbi:MAG: lipid asymmetry maintenance protein MlaB [Halochromatium sp.]|uniref:STAS domain-containing protein n=1 Tax=Halochromatium sp. TaxID=2049430 RepID=UPI00397AB08C
MTSQPLTTLSIYEVANLEASFAAAIENNHPLDLNLSELDEIDAAGIQWLLTLKQRKEQQGSALRLSPVPDSIAELFELLGVSSLLSTATQDSRDA